MKALYANLAAGVAVVLKNRVTAPLIAPEKQNVLQQQILQSFPASGGPIPRSPVSANPLR